MFLRKTIYRTTTIQREGKSSWSLNTSIPIEVESESNKSRAFCSAFTFNGYLTIIASFVFSSISLGDCTPLLR